MTETEFIKSIDCRFPYGDEEQWRALIMLGASISPNAAFMVLHELCRLPASVSVAPSVLQTMLDCWIQHFEHPLVPIVLPAATALIEGNTIQIDHARRIMEAVACYPGQHSALSIAYFAGYDAPGTIDDLYDEIVDAWKGE